MTTTTAINLRSRPLSLSLSAVRRRKLDHFAPLQHHHFSSSSSSTSITDENPKGVNQETPERSLLDFDNCKDYLLYRLDGGKELTGKEWTDILEEITQTMPAFSPLEVSPEVDDTSSLNMFNYLPLYSTVQL